MPSKFKDSIEKQIYMKGYRDGRKVVSDVDIKIKMVQVLKNTKGVGMKTIEKVLETLKEME